MEQWFLFSHCFKEPGVVEACGGHVVSLHSETRRLQSPDYLLLRVQVGASGFRGPGKELPNLFQNVIPQRLGSERDYESLVG